MLESYVEEEVEDVPSLLGCVNQCSHIFAESYLLTTGQWPITSSWERMPTLAACTTQEFCEVLRKMISMFCSEWAASAILPMDVIHSNQRCEAFGAALANGFLIKRIQDPTGIMQSTPEYKPQPPDPAYLRASLEHRIKTLQEELRKESEEQDAEDDARVDPEVIFGPGNILRQAGRALEAFFPSQKVKELSALQEQLKKLK